jgi:serine protease Do
MKSSHKVLFGFVVGVVFTAVFLAVFSIQTEDSASFQVPDSSAQSQQDEISNSRQNAITRAIQRVSPAVVSIHVRKIQYRDNPLAYDPFWRHFVPRYDRIMQEVQSIGSGFIFTENGHIITNQHVIDGAAEITVTLPGGEKHDAKLIGEDFYSDVAVIKIDGKRFPFIEFGDSDDLLIGEWAIAIGNPFGLFDVSAKPTVTVGVISAIDQDFGRQNNQRVYEDMIQTDAAINSGNSGGPLVNSEGKVIGMNAFIYSGNNNVGTSIGLGFAIPVNTVKSVKDDLLEHGSVPRDVWAGVQYQDVSPMIADLLNMKSHDGIIITDVERGSPWDEAGLDAEDVILEIGGRRIESATDVENIKKKKISSGDELELTVYRNRRIYRAVVSF